MWNMCKNIMISTLMTTLYAIWSKEGLHEINTLHMWVILLAVAILIFHLLNVIDREVKKIYKERKKKNEKTIRNTK